MISTNLAPYASCSCARRRLITPTINYHLSSARHWAAAVRNPSPRSPSAADKRLKQYSCGASPNLQRLQHITTFSNLSDAHICSRATLYHLACMGRGAWPLTRCRFPGGGYVGSRYLCFAPRCWESLIIISSDLIVDGVHHDTVTVQRSIGTRAMDRWHWLTIPRAPNFSTRSGIACCKIL
jgi:hypothetical protein